MDKVSSCMHANCVNTIYVDSVSCYVPHEFVCWCVAMAFGSPSRLLRVDARFWLYMVFDEAGSRKMGHFVIIIISITSNIGLSLHYTRKRVAWAVTAKLASKCNVPMN